ncbi:MAG: hypothetical protein K2L45_12475 [Muribaculaceae bacterium]|nr:hypothetical protein [Muribaculaceae bacterium]
MKTILKMLGGLILGGLLGLAIGGLIVVIFTETTFTEYLHKYYTLDISEGVAVFLVAVASIVVSLAIIVPIHEAGHLVCGLKTLSPGKTNIFFKEKSKAILPLLRTCFLKNDSLLLKNYIPV